MKRRNNFGTIISVGTTTKPAFAIRWWEGSRRKKKSGFRTRTEAAEALARVRTGLGDGTLIEKRRAGIGFDAAAREWLTLHSAATLRSHALNQMNHDTHVGPFFGDAPLSSITAERILQFRAHLQAAGLAARTTNLQLALLRSVLKFAVVNGHIPASPTDRLGRGQFMLAVTRAKLDPPIGSAAEVGFFLDAVREIPPDRYATSRPTTA